MDLVEAYEMVRLDVVWKAGVRMQFPLEILRLTLEASAFSRVLKLGKAFADPIDTLSAILAGGSFATDCLFLVLAEPLDELCSIFPQAEPMLFVDDVTIHVSGSAEEVATLQDIMDYAILELGGVLEVRISRAAAWQRDSSKKTVVTFSSEKLAIW